MIGSRATRAKTSSEQNSFQAQQPPSFGAVRFAPVVRRASEIVSFESITERRVPAIKQHLSAPMKDPEVA